MTIFKAERSSIVVNHCISCKRHVYRAYWHTQIHRQLATFFGHTRRAQQKLSREETQQRRRWLQLLLQAVLLQEQVLHDSEEAEACVRYGTCCR